MTLNRSCRQKRTHPQISSAPVKRMTVRAAEPGNWEGVRILLAPGPNGIGLDAQLVPQVAVSREGTRREWFTEEQMDSAHFNDSYKKSKINIFAPSEEDANRVVQKLQKAGVNFQKQGDLTGPLTENCKLLTVVASKVDDLVRRSIGKIHSTMRYTSRG